MSHASLRPLQVAAQVQDLRLTYWEPLRTLFTRLRGTGILGSSYSEGTKAHPLELGMPRGMRMMKVDPSPGLLRASMLPP